MDERFQFWTNPGSWPDDAYGFVFLARAVQRIGKATFPDEWTGKEAIAEPPIENPYEAVIRGVSGSSWTRWQEDYSRQLVRLIAARDPSKLSWVEVKTKGPAPLRTARTAASLGNGATTSTTTVLSNESRLYGESLIPKKTKGAPRLKNAGSALSRSSRAPCGMAA